MKRRNRPRESKERPEKTSDSLAQLGAYRESRLPGRLLEPFPVPLRAGQIGLVGGDPPRLLQQALVVIPQLAEQDPVVVHRIAPVDARRVDHQKQYRASFHVTQETMPETAVFRRPLDQPGNVRQSEPTIPEIRVRRGHPDEGVDRRERIGGALRGGVRQRAEQGRFSGVRKADQADVGDRLEYEGEFTGLPRGSFGVFPGSLVGRRLEVEIAQAPFASPEETPLLAVGEQLANRAPVRVDHRGSHRHREAEVGPAFPVPLAPLAGLPAPGPPLRLEMIST